MTHTQIMIEGIKDDIKQTQEEIEYFNGLYKRQLTGDHEATDLNIEILNNLKERLNYEQARLREFTDTLLCSKEQFRDTEKEGVGARVATKNNAKPKFQAMGFATTEDDGSGSENI